MDKDAYYFDKDSGEYIDPHKIDMSPIPTDAEREAGKLTKIRDEHQSVANKANTSLDMSQGMLDDVELKLAQYNLTKDKIAGDKNLNDVQKQTAFATLNNANRMLDSTLELAQKNVDDDTEIVKKANGKLLLATTNHKNHMFEMNNTLAPEELQKLMSIPRTKMDEPTREKVIAAIGLEKYKELPMI